MKAKNFAGAAMIYSILEDRFPEESELLKTKMMDVYKSLEAYQAVIDTGDAILSDPSLDRDTAIDIYIAKGLTYLRVSSQSNIKNDKIRYLDLAKQQFLQLLKDFRKIDIAVKGTVEELIGDCAYKQMSDKNLDTKAMYKEAVKYFNRALTRTDNLSKILKLNEKISNSTLRFNADIESIKSVISDFEQLRQEFGPSRETDMLLQNLGDLKLRLAQKSKDPEEKKECLKSAVDLYKEYIRVIKPKTRDNINFAVANILKQMGQNSKAVDYYKKIEAESFKSRKLESALFNMIYCYSNMKKYDQAILTAKRLLSDFPNFKPCYQNYKNKEVTDPMDSVVGRKLQNLQAQESGLDFSDMTDLDNPEIEYFYIPDTLDNYCNN
jgi:tetratricopeptide (TPR) repeat protein